MDRFGYLADQLDDAATDYVLAAHGGRLAEADERAEQGRETFGRDEWERAVDRVSATSWVGMLNLV